MQPLWARSMSGRQRGEARLALLQIEGVPDKGMLDVVKRVGFAVVLCTYVALFGERSRTPAGFVYAIGYYGSRSGLQLRVDIVFPLLSLEVATPENTSIHWTLSTTCKKVRLKIGS